MADRRIYINQQEKSVLKRYLPDSIQEIVKAQNSCRESKKMMEWARLEGERKALTKFIAKLGNEGE